MGGATDRLARAPLVVVAALLAAAIFYADVRHPPGVSLPGLYVVVVLLGLWSPLRRFTLGAALVASALTVLGTALSPSAGHWTSALNAATALLAVWVTAAGVVRYKASEKRLLEERRQARAYLEIAAVPIVALDCADRVVLINPRGSELVARASDELLGRSWIETAVPAAERATAREVFAGLRDGRLPPGHRYDMRVLAAGAEPRLVEWRGTPTRDAQGRVNGTLNSGEDTTEKHRVEALLASVVDSAPLMLLAIDASGVVTLAEGRGLRHIGFEPGQLVGVPSAERFGSLPWLAEPLRRALAGETATTSGTHRGAVYEVRTTPLLGPADATIGALGLVLDVTERARSEAALRRQESLAQLGALAAMVAHEVRNPLAGIRATIQVLSQRLADRDQATVKALFARLDALNDLTSDLLSYARPRPLKLAAIALKPLLEEARALLRRDQRWASVEVEVSGDDARAQADALALQGVFLNLLLNAAEAMGGRGTIRASVEWSPPGRCRVAIRDSGPGVPVELRERIFEPFFTTRHRGSGLGLAVVRRQVELHGGEVDVSCPESGGTVVTVTLPALVGQESPRRG